MDWLTEITDMKDIFWKQDYSKRGSDEVGEVIWHIRKKEKQKEQRESSYSASVLLNVFYFDLVCKDHWWDGETSTLVLHIPDPCLFSFFFFFLYSFLL